MLETKNNATTIKVRCLNNGVIRDIPRGTSLMQIAEILNVKLDYPILGALVNNCVEELSYEVYQPKKIGFIDITHPDGMRMYLRSLSFVLYKAVNDLFPNARLRINHNISKGYFCSINHMEKELSDADILKIKARMHEIIEADIPFNNFVEETEVVIKKFEASGLTDKINILRHRGENYAKYYEIDGCIDSFYGYLVPSTGYVKVFDLNRYYDGMLLQLPKKDDPGRVDTLIMQEKMFEILKEFSEWNQILDVTNVGELNKYISEGKSELLIKVSEALHEKKISQIADMINTRKDEVRVVLISGPSSSGKTTFGKRLAIQLLVNGIKPLNLSLDNYFVSRDKTPLDENGQYDFEALEAIDIELFNNNLTELLQGNRIKLPKFSFESGSRFYNGETMQMQPENILIIEGIHGLNPQLTSTIESRAKFKIYVSALTTLNIDDHNRISTTDNRLIRRIVRDFRYRKYSALDTISRWPSVVKGEEKHIFPFQEEADIMFNSAQIYELAVIKQYAEHILMEVQSNNPEYSEAKRLLKFFSYFKSMDSRGIPPTSILREFVGGSSFLY
ncbi:MAG TPA: nucleoside kinase [Bacteroidales bacterium]|nr:nucleoside kinase [Bacteroidales bacterium]HOH83821.1 nucleoside kinase [Bacteroidales bacterium]